MSTKCSCTSVHWRSVKKKKNEGTGRWQSISHTEPPLSAVAGNQQERLAEEESLVVQSEEGSRGET